MKQSPKVKNKIRLMVKQSFSQGVNDSALNNITIPIIIDQKIKEIATMNSPLLSFTASLSEQHYSIAFIKHLADTITSNKEITTNQEIYELIEKQSNDIISHFQNNPLDGKLIEYRNPLCFQSLRHYFHSMTKVVYKKYGNDIVKFKEGLNIVTRELLDILSAATSKIVKHAESILKDSTPKKILVYSYSKSISLTLKKLSKSLESNLQVIICKSGSLQQGIKLYEELVLDGVNCQLINDNEVGYYIHEVTCAIVGAEVILDNGAVLNRAGTSVVALLAHTARKPLYVFAQTYKFLRKTYLCQRDIPQRFTQDPIRKINTISIDLTLPDYITMFCTQSGLYNPEVISLQLSKIL